MKEYSHRATHSKYGSLQEMIFDRNRMLKDFFVQRGFDVDVIGDPNQPVIVITNFGYKFAVGAFVKNFKYNFTNIPFNGYVVKTIDLNQSNDDFTRDDLIDIFDEYEQREIFVLHKYQETHFMFNSIVAKYDNRHVYWSETDPHYFLSKQKAEDMKLMLFNEFNIKTVIVPEDEE